VLSDRFAYPHARIQHVDGLGWLAGWRGAEAGGGKAPAILHPVHGWEPAIRLLTSRRPERPGARSVRYADVNGRPGAPYLDADGRPVAVVSLAIADDLVQTVRAVTNPDKLRHLTPPADSH
jgi:RNA polymerase sigma-70 factor, ECF subfamily